jgi:regulator of protease activity HflC (stomatin/prohibitin superfamily)
MFDIPAIPVFSIPLVVILVLLASAIRILREYERGVVFTLGRFWKVKGPGLVILIPFVQQMVRIDLRTRVLDVPPQDVISRDNVSVQVNAVIYYRVMDPEKAILQVEDYNQATSELAQTTLRSVVGQDKSAPAFSVQASDPHRLILLQWLRSVADGARVSGDSRIK